MKYALLALLLSSSAVSAAGLPSPFTPFQAPKAAVSNNLTTLTVGDLTAALASANAQTQLPSGIVQPAPYNATVTGGDTRHGNCWAALIQLAGTIKAQQLLPSQMGLATLQQTIFNDQQLTGRPLLPDYVVINCALTINDAAMNFNQIITGLGLKAITVPKL